MRKKEQGNIKNRKGKGRMGNAGWGLEASKQVSHRFAAKFDSPDGEWDPERDLLGRSSSPAELQLGAAQLSAGRHTSEPQETLQVVFIEVTGAGQSYPSAQGNRVPTVRCSRNIRWETPTPEFSGIRLIK